MGIDLGAASSVQSIATESFSKSNQQYLQGGVDPKIEFFSKEPIEIRTSWLFIDCSLPTVMNIWRNLKEILGSL